MGLEIRAVKPLSEDIEFVIKEALSRYNAGKAEHGELDLSTDKGTLSMRQSKSFLTVSIIVSFRY